MRLPPQLDIRHVAASRMLKSFICCLLAGFLAGGAARASDPVERLQQRLDSGEEELRFDSKWGYLPSLLEAFEIPVSSQTLVFSKTSAQFRLITAHSPRAVYFNDDVYVGYVRGGPILEISAADPDGGGVFYTLSQVAAETPRFVRDNGQCLQCHESGRTQRIPGHLTRSVYPGPDGQPFFGAGSVDVDQTTPIEQRWGGWYVTGLPSALRHRGNATLAGEQEIPDFEAGLKNSAQNLNDLIDTSAYLAVHSDVVAHLLLAHQTQMHNYIALAAIETKKALDYRREMQRLFGEVSEDLEASVRRRIEGPSEKLLRSLLFVGEARLPQPLPGDSPFATEFQARGPRDPAGRSLRDLDLETRILKHPCSYLIYSEAFANLPNEVKRYVFGRMKRVLDGKEDSGQFKHLSGADRIAIRKILLETLPDSRRFWAQTEQ